MATKKTENKRALKELAIHKDPDAVEVTYISPQMIQCTLPHSDPGKTLLEWRRTNGLQTLKVRPSVNDKGEALYPWGSYPRLLMFWMTEEAVLTGSRILTLGRSMNQFTVKVGLDLSGGEDFKRFRDHMVRLFDATISFEDRRERYVNRKNMTIADESTMWWDSKRSQEENIWASEVHLSEKFHACITDPERRPVPLDYRVIDGIKRSPLAIDIYTTMTYAAYETQRRNRKELIEWADLQRRLGSDIKDESKFRQKARQALAEIHRFYPALRVDPTRSDYLIVHPSRPSVSKSKVFMIDSRVVEGGEVIKVKKPDPPVPDPVPPPVPAAAAPEPPMDPREVEIGKEAIQRSIDGLATLLEMGREARRHPKRT